MTVFRLLFAAAAAAAVCYCAAAAAALQEVACLEAFFWGRYLGHVGGDQMRSILGQCSCDEISRSSQIMAFR